MEHKLNQQVNCGKIRKNKNVLIRRNTHMNIPQDPAILLSYINTQLRDFYPTIEELCKSLDLNQQDLEKRLEEIDYAYDKDINQFV